MPRPTSSMMAVLPVVIFYAIFLAWPLELMIATSLRRGTAAYVNLFGDPLFSRAVVTTIQISLITTAITIVLAYICALAAWRSKGLLRGAIVGLVLVPLATSIMVKTLAWTIILQPNGVINSTLLHLGAIAHPLHLLYTRFAVVLGMVQYVVPYAFLPIYGSLMAIDARLEAAAHSLGASHTQSFVHVVLPMSAPGIAAAAILSFITSTGFFVTPALLGSPKDAMIANLIEYYARERVDFESASALGVLVFASLGLLAVYYQNFTKHATQRSAR